MDPHIKLKSVEHKFVVLLKNLREKIERLEKEKSDLLAEIDNLKIKGEERALELEDEVTVLRKEVKSLKKLLDTRENKESF